MSILKRLHENNVFGIYKVNKSIYIRESCDQYYDVEVTPQELIELGEEIKALGEKYLKEVE